jgi:hypothetical protein
VSSLLVGYEIGKSFFSKIHHVLWNACIFHSLKWMTPSTLPAVLGNTISPMLSRRTSFHTFLQELAQRHDQLDKALPAESPAKSCLAIKHPAFTCEIKVGYRLLSRLSIYL